MATRFNDLESVQQHIARAASAVQPLLRFQLREYLAELCDEEYESPLEVIFALYWRAFQPLYDPAAQFRLFPQFGLAPINGRTYRPDFLITLAPDGPLACDAERRGVEMFRFIFIELDGHDYHERTKEQVTDRNQRDRDLQQKGYRVLHFSGSELYRDPERVMRDVLEAVSEEWMAFHARLHVARQLLVPTLEATT